VRRGFEELKTLLLWKTAKQQSKQMLKLRGRSIPAVKKISVPSSAGFLEPETGAWHPVIGTILESSSRNTRHESLDQCVQND